MPRLKKCACWLKGMVPIWECQEYQMRYKVSDFAPHIANSGGVILTIAQRVGCDWQTVDRWIQRSPVLKAAFDAEREKGLDLAESVLLQNIRLAAKSQQDTQQVVDASDAKWLLAKRGSKRGYTERLELSGPEGDDIRIRFDRRHVVSELAGAATGSGGDSAPPGRNQGDSQG
jgi:hypothetical protein